VLSGLLPLSGGRWVVSPSIGYRDVDGLALLDATARVEFRPDAGWTLWASVTYSTGDFLSRMLLEFGAALRW